MNTDRSRISSRKNNLVLFKPREKKCNFQAQSAAKMDIKKKKKTCFISCTKAFDESQHEVILEILGKLDLDGKNMQIIYNLTKNKKKLVCE